MRADTIRFWRLARIALPQSIEEWARVYEKREHPISDNMPRLTWKESAVNLAKKVANEGELLCPKRNASLFFILFIVFVSVIFANNRYTDSDPRATLLVSESIINKGTIQLDHYGSETLDRYGYAVHKKNEHYYYYFPIGTSLASIPFVAVANAIGLDMLSSESSVQIIIASITSIITLLYLYKLASLFLIRSNALLISSVFWFGTSLSSTAGTALWSHNFATLFALLAIYSSVRSSKLNETPPWYIIAIFLFAAYLCRPTMAILCLFVMLFLFTYSRITAIKTGLLLASLLGIFILFSSYEFGQVLPDYYLPKRLTGGCFFEALYGNLLSPARGILIYSPFIIFAWLCLKYSGKPWGLKKSWLFIGLAWPVLHLIFISRFPHWWAGWSYGARFMTDVLPGLFLLTIYAWPTNFKPRMAKMLAGLLFLSCAFAIIVNTGQGLFNRYTALWNADPNIDRYPEYLFDWNYPQFLANKYGHESRLYRHGWKHLNAIHAGEVIDHKSNDVIYLGWSGAEPTHRWSDGNLSRIIFKLDTPQNFKGILKLHVGTLGEQKITMSINGAQIYSEVLEGSDKILEVLFNKSLLRDGMNTLAFDLPDARQPGNGDPRILALALKSFQIR